MVLAFNWRDDPYFLSISFCVGILNFLPPDFRVALGFLAILVIYNMKRVGYKLYPTPTLGIYLENLRYHSYISFPFSCLLACFWKRTSYVVFHPHHHPPH